MIEVRTESGFQLKRGLVRGTTTLEPTSTLWPAILNELARENSHYAAEIVTEITEILCEKVDIVYRTDLLQRRLEIP